MELQGDYVPIFFSDSSELHRCNSNLSEIHFIDPMQGNCFTADKEQEQMFNADK